MKRKMRIYRFSFLFLLFFVLILSGCTQEENKQVQVSEHISNASSTTTKTLKSEYGDNKELIRQAMLRVDQKISVIEEVEIVYESKDKGAYRFSGYRVESALDTSNGIEKAKLTLQVQKEEDALVKAQKFEFAVELKDVEAPMIALKEESIVIHESDELNLQDYVLRISDNLDEEVSDLKVTNPILKQNEKWICGEYEIHYIVKDTHGNQTDAILKVKVIEDLLDSSLSEPVLANLEKTQMNALALSLIGKPYVWGGKGPDAFDCSGIIMYIYNTLGMNLSWAQIQYGQGTSISLDPSSWQAGDVLSFSDNSGEIIHHAMYLGNGMVLHALVDGVKIVSVHTQLESGPGNPQRIVRVCRYK